MKLFFQTFLLLVLFAQLRVYAQDSSVVSRVIFIGDAGEMDEEQRKVIPDAVSRILPGKTTVMYLGDNIYPRGMGLPGSKEEKFTQQILQSQYQPFRDNGAPVYFIPGNHDWDRMGPQGLTKIKRQWSYLEEQKDSMLKLIPANGCPDPVALDVSDGMVIIALDSEWWLHQFNKDNPDAECNCSSNTDVINSLRELFYKNRHKIILLATHHPFQSYGTHGGYFSWKDHLFPLTIIKHDLYIPMPVIGSLYPIYRKNFTHPEDLRHPLYKNMIKNIDGVFKDFPNLIHVSGHEHGLQLIDNKDSKQFQIVSGGGAKQNYTIKGKHSLYGVESQGYVITDQMSDNNVRISYYVYEEGTIKLAYQYTWKYQPFDILEEATYNAVTEDSVIATAHPEYERSSAIGQFIFGKNYRREWAMPVKLPVIKVSAINGGLTPLKLGGGFQSTSLRLKDSDGKEYTLRTVEKKPDLVVPLPFQETFVRELLDDATSAQHPYSALVVPPLAQALQIPHASPIIGVVAADSMLGMYQKLFEGKVTLLEEREPLGDSENFIKMQKDLLADNDNSYDATNFLKARMLDVLLADWDRHGDQWRFHNQNKKGESRYYTAIPRDRDMALNITQGFLPTIIKRLLLTPRVHGFKDNVVPGSNYYLYKSAFLNAHPASQLSHELWTRTSNDFKQMLTDSVLESAIKSMPPDIYNMRYQQTLKALKARRDGMPKAMENYYRFSNKIVDIRTSNKNEMVMIADEKPGGGVRVTVRKINKEGELKDTIMSKLYEKNITKEIRLYTSKGDDSVVINNSSPIKLRIIGGKGDKAYNVIESRKNILLYDRKYGKYYGKENLIKKNLQDDSVHTAFVPVNMYSTLLPLLTAAINPDDGIFLGAGLRYMRQQGFRTTPYNSLHTFMASHSFSTNAFRVKYSGEWLHAIDNADLVVNADVRSPNNTQNFFGSGNQTAYDKDEHNIRYYRTRFNLYQVQSGLRWRAAQGMTLIVGPSLQYYHMDEVSNKGRFINESTELLTYDRANVAEDKMHLGIVANYTVDQRNDKVIPTWGAYVNFQVQGYTGLNNYSKSFFQFIPEIALYKSLNSRQTVILADRIGGGLTLGDNTFYQSMFLGGHDNLLGYRQYRFAGQQSFYNNLELRITLSDFGNYILKGQLGVIALHDIGRVWQKGAPSKKWHNGVGGGVFFAPAHLAVFRFTVSYSQEGWYPNFAMGFRF